MKKYRVTLTEDERAALGQQVCSGRGSARELARARILLKADGGPTGPVWADEAIAAALDVSISTVERVRKRFVEHGVDAAIRQRRPHREDRTSWTASRRPTSSPWPARRPCWAEDAGPCGC